MNGVCIISTVILLRSVVSLDKLIGLAMLLEHQLCDFLQMVVLF